MDPQVNPPSEGLEKAVSRQWHRHPAVAWIVCIILVAYTLAALAGIALFIRLHRGPIDLAKVTPVIEKILSRNQRLQFRINHAVLTWHGHDQPLTVDMQDLSLYGPMGEFLNIGQAHMGLSVWRLLLADVHFIYAQVQDLSARIIRLPDGTLTLTGSDTGKKAETAVKLQLDNIVNDLPDVGNLKLSNMRIIFEDQKEALIRRFDDVNVEINQSREFGGRTLSGYLTTTLSGINDGSAAALDFIYEPSDKTLTASASLERADMRQLFGGLLADANLPLIDMLVKGRADVTLNNDLMVQNLDLDLKGDDGKLYWPRNYGPGLEPQDLTKFELHAGFDPITQTLELQNAEITIKGITIATAGKITADAGWNKISANLNVNIPVLAVDAIPAVWPKVWESGGREWLVDRMDHGRFAHINIDVPLTATRAILPPDETDLELATQEAETPLEGEKSWTLKPGTIKGTFDYTGVTVDYRNPLLPAKNTTGTGVYEGLALTLDISKATIGGLNVTSGKLYFDDLVTPGEGNADLHFDMKGSVGAVFDYLDREPIAYRKKVSIDASNAQGNADVDLQINFPTLHDMKVEDVHVKAKAKLTNLLVPGAVKGLTLAGPAFDLTATENDFHIAGTGTLNNQPATIDWQEYFSPKSGDPFASRLAAKIQTSKDIRAKFIGTLEDRVDGIIPADVMLLTNTAGKGTLNVSAALDNAAIDFTDPFNAVKQKGQAAALKLTAILQNNNIQSIDSLSVTGPGMGITSGSIAFNRDAKGEPVLAKALIKGLRLGENNADIDVLWPDENSIKATITGQAFDARAILGNNKTAPSDANAPKPQKTPMAYDATIKVDRLFVGDLPLDGAQGTFVGNTGGTVKLANLNGSADGSEVTLAYTANGNAADRLLLDAANAGKGLAALGITTRVRGGTMHLDAKPIDKGQPGDMKGKLVLKDFGVAQAPVLAKLINLLSLPGILSILNQDTGLKFTRAESDVTLLNRPGGIQLKFKDGRTSGSSLGLTFEGTVDTATGTMNIQGTAVPMSEVNSMLSSIPLVGEILTGGKKGGGIFAATYTMKGNTSDPDVSINPLSVLTPGILRRILFEGG